MPDDVPPRCPHTLHLNIVDIILLFLGKLSVTMAKKDSRSPARFEVLKILGCFFLTAVQEPIAPHFSSSEAWLPFFQVALTNLGTFFSPAVSVFGYRTIIFFHSCPCPLPSSLDSRLSPLASRLSPLAKLSCFFTSTTFAVSATSRFHRDRCPRKTSGTFFYSPAF